MKEVRLAEGVRLKAHHFAAVRQDYEFYRIVLHFISDIPDRDRLIKEYFVWLSERYVDDYLHLRRATTQQDYEKVALELAAQRFNLRREVPEETGLDVSQDRGVIPVADVAHYTHPIERGK